MSYTFLKLDKKILKKDNFFKISQNKAKRKQSRFLSKWKRIYDFIIIIYDGCFMTIII